MSLNMTLRKRKALSPTPSRRVSSRTTASSSLDLVTAAPAPNSSSQKTTIVKANGYQVETTISQAGQTLFVEAHNVQSGQERNLLPPSFQRLPIELNEKIASLIDSDVHFGLFAQLCHCTFNAVYSKNKGAFRDRFAFKFDVPPGLSGDRLMWLYVNRRMKLCTRTFRSGTSPAEVACLNTLRDLVLESYIDAHPTKKNVSNNLIRLEHFLLDPFTHRALVRYYQRNQMELPADSKQIKEIGSNFLQHYTERGAGDPRKQHKLFKTLRVVFTHWSLDLTNQFHAKDFMTSQKVVYGLDKTLITWDHGDDVVDMDHLLHIVNFFQFHVKMIHANTLNGLFLNLPDYAKPQAWTQRLTDSDCRPFGPRWKGAYAYLPGRYDVEMIRLHSRSGEVYADAFDEDKGLLDLQFDFSAASNSEAWPEEFEVYLNAIPFVFDNQDEEEEQSSFTPDLSSVPEPVKGQDYLQFRGNCSQPGDDRNFGFAGIVHGLDPQCGIPGWQRFSMMKFPNGTTDGNRLDPFELANVVVDSSCWCYEGVVLPGGRIILGRYWNAMDDDSIKNTGPFIFWETDHRATINHLISRVKISAGLEG